MKKHPYKLLVVDIDGTLMDKNGSISADDRKALARVCRSGVQVALSTGRVPQSCLRIIEELSLNGNHIFFDGALVGAPDAKEKVYLQPLNEELVRQAVQFVRSEDIYLELYSESGYFVERETRSAAIHRDFFDIEPVMADFSALLDNERIIKAELFVSSPEEESKAEIFASHFDGNFRYSKATTPAYPDVHFVIVVDPQVSKGKALEALTSHLGVSISEVIAVGDGINDIPLLSAAGLAIAMGDAPVEVRAVADYITYDVERCGLAAAIERFLL